VLGINEDDTTRYCVLNVKSRLKLWEIPDGQRIVCEYNSACQPIGQCAVKFRRVTGLFIRSGNYV
jgi:hypothetical protein